MAEISELLRCYGWDARWQEAWRSAYGPDVPSPRVGTQPGAIEPARVIAEHRGGLVVVCAGGEHPALPAGTLRRRRKREPAALPAVGDWVAALPCTPLTPAVIQAVLPRRTVLVRQASGSRKSAGGAAVEAQVLAANVDVVFLVNALDAEFNPRRIERFLVLAAEGRVEPVLVLTKADLCADLDAAVALASRAAPGVPVLPVSARTGHGLAELEPFLHGHRTVALLGLSGAGKSTLVNRWLGQARQAVGEVDAAGEGRHITTHRALLALPGGGLVVDTPGLRELALWQAEAGLAEVFPEFERPAAACRFRDCRHAGEPGCAIAAAAEVGEIDPERLESYRKLARELGHQRRSDKLRGLDARRARKSDARMSRAIKDFNKHQRK